MKYEYYYNNVPGKGLCRNNLIYTSLITEDKKTFCQWYYNDTEYHKNQNEVVDPKLMNEKFKRELHYLSNMAWHNPDMVPKIKEVNIPERKIYLEIDGPDFWEQAGCDIANYDKVVPDWQDQMLSIIQAHKNRGWYKYSMHPSSYFVVDGKLKSINYFFTYHKDEGDLRLKDHESHISSDRKQQMKQHVESLGVSWDQLEPQSILQQLCFDSFISNYPQQFIDQAKAIYNL